MDTSPRPRSLSLLALLTACALGQDADVGSLSSPLPAFDMFGATASVGTLPGELSVDFDGVAHYAIPIEVPPARAGHEPALAFSYSSSDAVGLLGRGWSLRGLSAITRCARTLATDGFRRAVAYDADDAFCLDGARLLPAGDGPTDEYRTEEDSSIRAFAQQGGDIVGPSAWKVLRPDGTTWLYGMTPDSQVLPSTGAVVASWQLTSVRDPFGNEIVYRYAHHAAPSRGSRGVLPSVRPVEILYGGHEDGLAATYAVRLSYETRPDPLAGFSGGYHWAISHRMTRVEIATAQGATKPIRTYDLEYSEDGATGASRVEAVRECVDAPAAPGATLFEGRVCRPVTRFEWEVGEATIRSEAQVGEWTNAIPGGEQSLANGMAVNRWGAQTVLDANGDGKSDIAYVADGELFLIVGGDTLGAPVATSVRDLWAIDHHLYPYDVDGDGRDDIVFIAAEDVVPGSSSGDEANRGSRGTARVMVAYSRGLDFVVTPTSATYPYSDLPLQDIPGERSYLTGVTPNPVFTSSNSYVADFDGDGRPDVLSCETMSDENPGVSCSRRVDNGLKNDDLQPPVTYHSACRGEWTLRGNLSSGGERQQLGLRSVCDNQRSSYAGAVMGDFTGDGVPDLFFMDREVSYLRFESGGPSVLSVYPLENGDLETTPTPPSWLEWKVLTFDHRWSNGSAVVLSTGISFADQMAPIVADVDGDGVSDIITLEDNGADVYTTRASFNVGRSPRLIRNVWLSTGGELGSGDHFAREPALRFVRVESERWTPNAHLQPQGDPLLRRYMACQFPGCDRIWKWISMRRDVAIDLNGDGRHDLLSAGTSDVAASNPEYDWDTNYYVARPMTRIAQPGCILAGSGRVGHTRRGGRPAP